MTGIIYMKLVLALEGSKCGCIVLVGRKNGEKCCFGSSLYFKSTPLVCKGVFTDALTEVHVECFCIVEWYTNLAERTLANRLVALRDTQHRKIS